MKELEDIFPAIEKADDGGVNFMLLSPKDRMKWGHQIKVLEDDRNDPYWEKAHLVLFILAATPGTRWYNTMFRAYKAYVRGDKDRFDKIINELKDFLK